MSYEVEQKFYVTDLSVTERALKAFGSDIGEAIRQIDTYLSHPGRDFAATDEAFRLRQVGDENLITYKGPKIDQTTKTRFELELLLPPGQRYAEQFRELLGMLGFGIVVKIEKRRRKTTVKWQGSEIEVSLDEVDRLGTFVELEMIVQKGEIEDARQHLSSLASKLGLSRDERLSYCELMLKRE